MVLSTQTTNVVRYSALGLGVFYGLYHQRTLTSQSKVHQAQAEYCRKEALIQQAKAEWAKTHPPKESKTKSGSLITDPDDSRFDLEAFLKHVAGEDKARV